MLWLEPLEYGILFLVDLYGNFRLLIPICLTLIISYPSKILLRLIWSICSAFFYFTLFMLINRSGIFKRYNVVSVRQLWVSKRMHPYRLTKKTKFYILGVRRKCLWILIRQLANFWSVVFCKVFFVRRDTQAHTHRNTKQHPLRTVQLVRRK